MENVVTGCTEKNINLVQSNVSSIGHLNRSLVQADGYLVGV